MKNLLEVVKENKKTIIKGALIVGGTILAAVIVSNKVRGNDFSICEELDNVIDITPEEEIKNAPME